MRLGIIAFALGVWLAQIQAELPGWLLIAGLTATFACVLAARLAWPLHGAGIALVVASVGLGFGYACAMAKSRIADRLDEAWEGRDLTLTGVVANLPQSFERGVRFQFDVEDAVAADSAIAVPSKVLLSWYRDPASGEEQEVLPLRAGERWRLTVRLRRPHGNANPHGFDYELWLLERGIGATGYVRHRGERTRIAPLVARPAYLVERLRERIRDKFRADLPAHRYAGVLIALAIGDQRAIEGGDWETFTRTGVGHLMSISGLHVTMVSGLFGALVLWCWRRAPRLTARLAAPKAAAAAAVLAAATYTLMAGAAVPAQRTLYMVAVVAAALWFDRMQSSSRVLLAALALVLVLDPWAVVSPGFWLSFGAVALILYVGRARHADHWLVHWGRVQWAITVGLAPLLLVLFQQVSVVSPIANALAIPVVSFVVTPLALGAAVVPGPWLGELAHHLFALLMVALDWLAAAPGAVWRQHAPPLWSAALALVGVAWMLAPRGVPARFAAPLLLAPMFALRPSGPVLGEAWVTVLDVGQGLAVTVRTANHALQYDAGPSWGADVDAGNRVVVPYLRGEGLARLDALVISHQDSDHSGGAASVMHALPTTTLWSSLDASDPIQSHAPIRLPCRAGVRWQWDGVSFQLLHPAVESYDDPRLKSNWRSCVLRIATARHAVLLTGDIEARDERRLLASSDGLRASVLLAPHHGSGTSSTAAFIDAVKPAHAVFAVGYRNRFGHPKREVLARYEEAGANVWRTDRDGAVTMQLTPDGVTATRYREAAPRYWR